MCPWTGFFDATIFGFCGVHFAQGIFFMPLLSIFSVIILSKAVFLIPPYTSIFGFFGVNLHNTFFDATIFGVCGANFCSRQFFWCHYLRIFLLAFVLSKVPLVDVTIFGFSMLILFGQRFCCHYLTVSWFEFCSRQFVWCSYLCFLLWGRLHKERKKTSLSDCLMSHGASAMSMYARFLCLMWWFVLLMIVLLLLWTACKAKIHAKNYSRTIENMVT